MKIRHPLRVTPFRLVVPDPDPSSARIPVAQPQPRIIPIKSASGPGTHLVRVTPDGRLICPCRGFGYRQTCRHVGEARLVMMGDRNNEPAAV